MDVFVKGRGQRVTDQLRETATHKLSKLSRLEPRAGRVEIEVMSERNPRQNGTKRLEGTVVLPRRTFRASASAPGVEAALDLLVARLERQVRDYRDQLAKRKKRLLPWANRLKSPRTGPE